MAVETVKSSSITNADASPYVRDTQGSTQPAHLKFVDDYVTIPASSSDNSVLRVVRIPTTAKVKRVTIESEAQGAGHVNVGLYYSSSTQDSPGADDLAGAVIDEDFFASEVDLAAAVVPTDITSEGGFYTLDERGMPIWQAVGLSADPGGYFDVALTVTATAITTGTGKTGLRVEFAP